MITVNVLVCVCVVCVCVIYGHVIDLVILIMANEEWMPI